jgi:hypothetical protein
MCMDDAGVGNLRIGLVVSGLLVLALVSRV